MPFAFVSAALGSCIIYSVILDTTKPDFLAFAYVVVAIWTCFVLAEQLCIAFLLMLKNRMNATIAVTYILVVCLALASGTVRYGQRSALGMK
jgi:ATP-binding cassette, subfamily G (WHITE), member 5 (sterolin 1)